MPGQASGPGCYTIEFAFTDLYAGTEVKKVQPGNTGAAGTTHVATQNENEPAEESGNGTNTDQLIETAKTTTDENPLVARTATFGGVSGYSLPGLVSSGMLVMLGVALFVVRLREFLPTLKKQNISVIDEHPAQLPSLGQFLFDVTNQRLLIGSEVISLTDKECRILELLNQNFGELISRETLMQEVWINEGVITGRSLDMFVSKLRKKLTPDPELRITNIHGKGYKLVSCQVS